MGEGAVLVFSRIPNSTYFEFSDNCHAYFHLLDFETLLFGTLWWGRIDVLP